MTLKEISNDLANQFDWTKKEHRFCPVLTSGLSSNVKIYEDEVFSSIEEAEDRAREMIDEGYKASNNIIARDYAVMHYIIDAYEVNTAGMSGYTVYR